MTQKTETISFLLALSLLGVKYFSDLSKRNAGSLFNGLEKTSAIPALFGFIVLIQGLFGNSGFETPERLSRFLEIPIVSVVAMFLVAYSGTRDVELAFAIVLAFLLSMQLLRTEEERKRHPYLI